MTIAPARAADALGTRPAEGRTAGSACEPRGAREVCLKTPDPRVFFPRDVRGVTVQADIPGSCSGGQRGLPCGPDGARAGTRGDRLIGRNRHCRDLSSNRREPVPRPPLQLPAQAMTRAGSASSERPGPARSLQESGLVGDIFRVADGSRAKAVLTGAPALRISWPTDKTVVCRGIAGRGEAARFVLHAGGAGNARIIGGRFGSVEGSPVLTDETPHESRRRRC